MASLMQLTGLVLVIVHISKTAAADAQLNISVSNWSPVQGESFTVTCSLLRNNADGVGWQIRYYKHNEGVVETICTFDSRRETKETEPWRCDLYSNPNSGTTVMEAKIDNITESYTGIVWCETHTPLRRNKSESVFVKTDKGAGKVISRTDETSACSICLYWIIPTSLLVIILLTFFLVWRCGLTKKCGGKCNALDAHCSANRTGTSILLQPTEVDSGISHIIEEIKGLTNKLRNGKQDHLAEQIDSRVEKLHRYIKTGQIDENVHSGVGGPGELGAQRRVSNTLHVQGDDGGEEPARDNKDTSLGPRE